MNDEKEIKSILKSLTISSSKGITVSNLCNDYREIIGSSIPYKAMGHSDLMSFLNNIPDTLVIAGTGMSALVIPVTDEKTMHLEKMIQKQKKTTSTKGRRRNCGRFDNRRIIQRPNAIKKESNTNTCSESISHKEDENTFTFSKPNILPIKEIQKKYNNWNDVSSDESESTVNHVHSNAMYSSSPIVQNSTKLRIRANNNSYNEFVASSISRTFIDPFKDKLRKLISNYPDGIWCSELPQYYKKHFNENLNVVGKGYCSVIHFCTSHSDIFHCVKPNKGDWKIYDAKRTVFNFNKEIINDKYGYDEPSSSVVNVDNALPELDITDILHFSNENIDMLPNNILQFGEKLPRQWLKIPDDGFITVRVTEIYDPSKFWLQIYSEDCSLTLDTLMNEMQTFYVLNDTHNIPSSDVQVGLYCVSLIYNEWHRGIVVKIEDPYVKVFYFDYGSIGKSLKNSLKYLHKKFCDLPRQAIRARLANIRPRYPAVMWSPKASKLLLKLVNNRILVAEVINSLEIEHHALHVILTDTTDPHEDVHINDVFKKQGFAELMTDVCKVNSDFTETDNELFDEISINLSSRVSCDNDDLCVSDHIEPVICNLSKLTVNNSIDNKINNGSIFNDSTSLEKSDNTVYSGSKVINLYKKYLLNKSFNKTV